MPSQVGTVPQSENVAQLWSPIQKDKSELELLAAAGLVQFVCCELEPAASHTRWYNIFEALWLVKHRLVHVAGSWE